MWSRVLKSTGFSGLDMEVHDFQEEERYSHSLILSTAVQAGSPTFEEGITIVSANDATPEPWTTQLQQSLAIKSKSSVFIHSIDQADVEGKLCVFLDNFNQCVLLDKNASKFHKVRETLNAARGLLWVSFGGALNGKISGSGTAIGLLRTLRFENRTKRYVGLDVEASQQSLQGIGHQGISDVFMRAFSNLQLESTIDLEYMQRGDEIYIPRYVDNASDNEFVNAPVRESEPEPRPFREHNREVQMNIKTPGLMDSLYFQEVPSFHGKLPEDIVEIEPAAFGLNFRDIMVAMGQLNPSTMGFECSGIVTRVGPSATHDLKVGDRVCALTRGNWATFNRVHWTSISRIPEAMSFEVAAAVPVIYVTAYYSLYELARLQPGETILIHAAAGGVGQAAIALAQLAGAEVYATVGSDEKRNFLVEKYGLPPNHIFYSRNSSFAKEVKVATKGKGVDVILNSLSGLLLQETWNCIANFGRFVEIGKRDLEQNSSLKMAPFTRAASFFAVDLLHLRTERGALVNKMLVNVMAMLGQNKISPVGPIKLFPISELNKAFRVLQAGKHYGKIVVTAKAKDVVNVSFRDPSIIVVAKKSRSSLIFPPCNSLQKHRTSSLEA